jgi:acyl-coenzyme A synthetase/AMP-(fatty) acid ligase
MARREAVLRDAGCTDISALPHAVRIPRLLIVIDEFPRTASGKIRKADLRKRFA